MSKLQSEAPTVGLGRLLSEGSRFEVPHHQRDYSWTEDELGQLFQDIDEAQSAESDYYFLGLMVFIPTGDDGYTILDGQQRLATTVIILSAIRNWLRGYGFDRDADDIQKTFIAHRELGEDDLDARLVLNEANNHHFFSYVVSERPTADVEAALQKLRRHDPNRRLIEAVLFCRTEIAKIASAESAPQLAAKRLYKLVRYLRDNIRNVRLTVPSEADAYTVFETLNDRGLDLTVLDLVKNYIFGKVGSKARLRELRNRWTQMMSTLANVRGDDFLKAYWTSRHGRTQKAQLFPSIKKQYRAAETIVKLSVDLQETAVHYAALELSDDPIWSQYTEVARERIRTLEMLRAQSIHPIMLSGLAKLPHREMERLLWLLEVLVVRYQLIGGGRTGLLEIASARLAADIYQGKILTTTRAFQALKDIFPNDEEFRDAFAVKQERNNTKAQYLLRNLEEQERKKVVGGIAGAEWEPKALTVEHILPTNPGSEWEPILASDPTFAEDCTYRLGNLTLLTGVNKELGRKSFKEKKKVYATSSLLLTRGLGSTSDWNRGSVERRQEHMASLAVARWRFQ